MKTVMSRREEEEKKGRKENSGDCQETQENVREEDKGLERGQWLQ